MCGGAWLMRRVWGWKMTQELFVSLSSFWWTEAEIFVPPIITYWNKTFIYIHILAVCPEKNITYIITPCSPWTCEWRISFFFFYGIHKFDNMTLQLKGSTSGFCSDVDSTLWEMCLHTLRFRCTDIYCTSYYICPKHYPSLA